MAELTRTRHSEGENASGAVAYKCASWGDSLLVCVQAHLGEGKGRREHMLQVSVYQCAILLLFNTADELSYLEIKVCEVATLILILVLFH